MQLYALDDQQCLVFASQAQKQKNYCCLECQAPVRLRGGLHRQDHFYHIHPNRHCHLSGKSLIHLQVQYYFLDLLSDQDCRLEQRFPEIKRIADVAWLSQKIIFEIQCSSISAEEILQRHADYQKLGWQVVWIFHEQFYNQTRLTAAEWVIRSRPHYFTNLDTHRQGMIYDQFAILKRGQREYKLDPLPIDIRNIQRLENKKESKFIKWECIRQRRNHWPLIFKGDLVYLSQHIHSSEAQSYLNQVEILEKAYFFSSPLSKWQKVKSFIWSLTIRPYHLLFQILLERACR